MKNLALFFILMLVLTSPLLAGAEVQDEGAFFRNTGLVPCGNPGTPECDWEYLTIMLGRILNFAVLIAAPVAALAIAWSGIMIVTNPANESRRTAAKKMLWTALIGLVLVLAAWLIVKTILDWLVDPNFRGNFPIS